jgi:23S rRNA pseudouridine1911/1915/1917 synthase
LESADPQKFHVAPSADGQTLAAWLRRCLVDRAWSQVDRLIRGRHVTIHGNLCVDSARRLRAGEVVHVFRLARPSPPTERLIIVAYLDTQIVVVEKPPGITSVRHHSEKSWSPRRRQVQPTLEDLIPRLIDRAGGKARRRPDRRRRSAGVFPVHRLDRDTSGLMVFARTAAAKKNLEQQFRRHETERRYLAVVEGSIADQTIESHLVRNRGDGRRGSSGAAGKGKRAVTHVRTIEHLAGRTLVECRLETGRTHQIRIHLAEAGHPVCGETVYAAGHKRRPGEFRAPRLALHAAELGLVHPVTGKSLRFTMPLPEDLDRFVRHLRRCVHGAGAMEQPGEGPS